MGCRRAATPGELIRLSVGAVGELVVGPGPGRGAWLCRDSPRCLEQAARRQAFGRALYTEVVLGEIERLRKLVGSNAPPGEVGAHVCEDGGSGRTPGLPPDEEEGP